MSMISFANPGSTRDHTSILAGGYLSVADRMAAGKALRQTVRHSEQGAYKPSPQREDPIAILEDQAKTHLPDLVPIRYQRMLTSPFAFLRGVAMIQDIAPAATTGIQVQACGNTHMANFGVTEYERRSETGTRQVPGFGPARLLQSVWLGLGAGSC